MGLKALQDHKEHSVDLKGLPVLKVCRAPTERKDHKVSWATSAYKVY